MRHVLVVAVVVAVCSMIGLAFAEGPAAAQAPLIFGGVATDVTSAQMTVKAIDKETRIVTLKTEAGEDLPVKCGPEVRNFAQIAVGDKVNVDYTQSISVIVLGPGAGPSRTEAVDLERAPLGAKPAAVATMTTDVSAVVEAVDAEAGVVTVKGPERTIAVKVNKNSENLKELKVGDSVNLSFTEQLAISVTK